MCSRLQGHATPAGPEKPNDTLSMHEVLIPRTPVILEVTLDKWPVSE